MFKSYTAFVASKRRENLKCALLGYYFLIHQITSGTKMVGLVKLMNQYLKKRLKEFTRKLTGICSAKEWQNFYKN